MTSLLIGGTQQLTDALGHAFGQGLIDHNGRPTASGRALKAKQTAAAQPVSPEDAIRQKVSTARQAAPHIAADTADKWIAEGITPDQAAMRLYDLISEPIEAAKIVAQYRASKGKG